MRRQPSARSVVIGRKACPQCAERIRREARVCRYCGYRFSDGAIVEVRTGANWRLITAAVASASVVGVTGWMIYNVWRDFDSVRASADKNKVHQAAALPTPEPLKPQYEQLALGTTLEWIAKDSPAEVVRQAGPFVVTITKKQNDDLFAPVVKVSNGSQSVTMEGESVWPSYSHQISFIQNRSGAGPAIMLQSFSGGAHCCNSIQVAGLAGGKLQVADLGSWDGDTIELPRDISGDGVVDFVMYDNSFLYAFASYADSYAPPQVFNIVNGEVKDVSRNPAFKALYVREMQEAGERCRAGLGMAANGACPAFVASAARVGKLERAWSQMLAAYDASIDWDLPTGCVVSDKNGCPDGAEIKYKSYPEALLAFLKREGYISPNWLPPEAFQRPENENPRRSSEDWTA